MSYGARVILGDRPVQVHLPFCTSFSLIIYIHELAGYFDNYAVVLCDR